MGETERMSRGEVVGSVCGGYCERSSQWLVEEVGSIGRTGDVVIRAGGSRGWGNRCWKKLG